MEKVQDRKEIINELLKTTDEEFSDEQLMLLLIEQKVSANTEKNEDQSLSFGQKAADSVAKFAGSWGFIFSFLGMMVVWMAVNVLLAIHAFDSYPFILLNLVLSCIAAIQAPLIMMSQNRQEEKDRTRAENDYKVNLKNELIIDDLHVKIDTILQNQDLLQQELLSLREELRACKQIH